MDPSVVANYLQVIGHCHLITYFFGQRQEQYNVAKQERSLSLSVCEKGKERDRSQGFHQIRFGRIYVFDRIHSKFDKENLLFDHKARALVHF
jgi:hypothetical protein